MKINISGFRDSGDTVSMGHVQKSSLDTVRHQDEMWFWIGNLCMSTGRPLTIDRSTAGSAIRHGKKNVIQM